MDDSTMVADLSGYELVQILLRRHAESNAFEFITREQMLLMLAAFNNEHNHHEAIIVT